MNFSSFVSCKSRGERTHRLVCATRCAYFSTCMALWTYETDLRHMRQVSVMKSLGMEQLSLPEKIEEAKDVDTDEA